MQRIVRKLTTQQPPDHLRVQRAAAGRHALPTSHFLVEDEPIQTADALSAFFGPVLD